ncbi:MAG: formylglycine-generating enzyme family protein [Anaerolineaceae bacterium]|nr:formylglycine-generating enzyme family protein [Anaerolineaceae bacterium]
MGTSRHQRKQNSNNKINTNLIIGLATVVVTFIGIVLAFLSSSAQSTKISIYATETAETQLTSVAMTQTIYFQATQHIIESETSTLIPTITPTSTITPTVENSLTPTPTPYIVGDMAEVPGGAFIQGSTEDQINKFGADCVISAPDCSSQFFLDELPLRHVILDTFWIDVYEVTNSDFQQFVIATNYRTTAEKAGVSNVYHYKNYQAIPVQGSDWQHPQGPGSNLLGKSDYPVSHISWDDAKAYCTWLKMRLPTEAEWEKAARGPDGLIYPWGNDMDGSRFNHYEVALSAVQPVGSYSNGVSVYGIQDMLGNVAEWTADYYAQDYYSLAPAVNPQGPDSGTSRVLRGGSFGTKIGFFHSAWRTGEKPDYTSDTIGFRCASSTQP